MKPILVFQTDFTYKEGAVCAMYGVAKSVDPSLDIMDGSHELPKFDTWSASYRLYQSMKFWPKGTIFVSVVDPGVGTKRRASVAKTSDGYYVVSPDNGSFTHLKEWVGLEEIREIDEETNRLKGKDTEGVAIFHGRDLFGYCAAKLAAGKISYEEVGPSYPLEEVITHPIHEPSFKEGKGQGIFEINDPNFGNMWTNIPTKTFQDWGFSYGDQVRMQVVKKGEVLLDLVLPFADSFGSVAQGDPVIYNNELMKIALAKNQGSFEAAYGLSFGQDYRLTFEKVDGKKGGQYE